MMYIRWLLLAFVSLAFTALAMILAPILPLFATCRAGPSDNGNSVGIEPRLPHWLSWFSTPDNSLWGDTGWRTQHCPQWQSYWGMVRWLLRNPAYGFEWGGPLGAQIDPGASLTVSGDPATQNQPHGREGYCFTRIDNPDGSRYWGLYWVKRVGQSRCLNVTLGWKLKTYAEDPARIKTEPRAMFALSPRIATFEAQP